MKKGSVIGFIILFISLNNNVLAQNFLQEKIFSLPPQFRDSILPLRWQATRDVDFKWVQQNTVLPLRFSPHHEHWRSFPFRTEQVISPSEVVERWGFFCRQEWVMEKKIKVPVRFRLGTVSYVDYLEGKQKPLEWSSR